MKTYGTKQWVSLKSLFKNNHQKHEHKHPFDSRTKGLTVPRIPAAKTRTIPPLCLSVRLPNWSTLKVFLGNQIHWSHWPTCSTYLCFSRLKLITTLGALEYISIALLWRRIVLQVSIPRHLLLLNLRRLRVVS